jgi:hypothetical protein
MLLYNNVCKVLKGNLNTTVYVYVCVRVRAYACLFIYLFICLSFLVANLMMSMFGQNL